VAQKDILYAAKQFDLWLSTVYTSIQAGDFMLELVSIGTKPDL
jgi:hypothetical protein